MAAFYFNVTPAKRFTVCSLMSGLIGLFLTNIYGCWLHNQPKSNKCGYLNPIKMESAQFLFGP
ncbi:hypothetical protein DF947_12735 [Pedobacter paludis]|uniref:Uncharacterized protein n=1 Tax=Pedobacter paludis TaxID=2203212 RepID=A0A317F1X8_9SPHI|nr:hypothetical protein DF947_12735 [Pedobacter paludis]